MSSRTKALAITGVIWLAAIITITIGFVVRRPTLMGSRCRTGATQCPFRDIVVDNYRGGVSWPGWWAWTGVVTLVAIVAAIIIVITTAGRRS